MPNHFGAKSYRDFMKPILFLILLLPSFTYAQKAPLNCKIAEKSLQFKTPTSSDITHTLWQESNEENETVRRLYITYKDGSVAVLEHKYCSTYNFEVAYYVGDKSKLSTTKEVQKKAESFFSYASLSDSSQHEAITTMIRTLNERKFDAEKKIATGYRGFDPKHGDTEYSIDYFPLGDVSVHQAALFVYMGLGVMH